MGDVKESTMKDRGSWMTGLDVSLDGNTINVTKGTYTDVKLDGSKDTTSLEATSLELIPDDTYLASYGLFIVCEDGVVKYSTSRYVQFLGDTTAPYTGGGMPLVNFIQASITVDGQIEVEVVRIEEDDSPPPEPEIPPDAPPSAHKSFHMSLKRKG